MMRRIAGVMAACGVLAGAAVPVRADTLNLAAVAPWTIDYADDSCALRRDFGTAESPVFLELRQFEPGDMDFQVIVASAHHRLAHQRNARDVAVRFHPDDQASAAGAAFNMQFSNHIRGLTFSTSLLWHQLDQIPQFERVEDYAAARAAVFMNFDRHAREREVTAMELIGAFRDNLVLETGSLAAPMRAMDTCLDELLTHWGIDAAAHHTLRQSVVPLDMEVWSREISERYPGAMAHLGEQAVLRIRLGVTPEGHASDCHLQTRLGEEEFERTACDSLVRNARFSPAIDANGDAIASYYILMVVYSLS